MAGVTIVGAAVRTLDGGGDPDVNWSTPANWDGDTTALVANDDLVFAGSVGLTNNNDFAADTNFKSITFTNDAGPFWFDGNTIKLSVGVTNLSSVLQTFNIQAKNNTSVHYVTTGGDIMNVNKLWDWRWYKHGPYKLVIAATNTVSGLNGNVLGIDGGIMVFNSQPNAGVIGQGLKIDAGGTVQVVGPSTNQIADSRDVYT